MPPSRLHSATRSIAESFVIDQALVHSAISACLDFADGFYGLLRRDPGTTYLGASLTGIQQKLFGQLPSGEVNSFRMPDHRLDEPLSVPDRPLSLTTEQLRSTNDIASIVVDHFARRFRLENVYYPQGL